MFQPGHQQTLGLFFDLRLHERTKLAARRFALGVRLSDKFTHGHDQCAQVVHTEVAGIQRALFEFGAKVLADFVVEQGKLIREVGVERGAVDLSHVSDILHGDGVETLFSQESFNGLQDQAAGAFDAGVKFLIGVGQHFRSCVA